MDWTCNVCGWALKDAKNWDSDSICPLCERKGDESAAAGVEHQWMSSSDAVKALIEGRSLEGVFVQQLRLDDLKLENMRLVDCIVLHLSALRVHISGDADCSGTRFVRRAVLGGLRIEGNLDFSGAQIDAMSVRGARVGGDLSFEEAKVGEALYISGVVVEGFSSLRSADVAGEVHIGESLFKDEVDLTGATILGPTTIDATHFERGLELRDVSCLGSVELDSLELSGWVDMLGADFHRPVRFHTTSFHRGVDLQYAHFRDSLDAQNVEFKGEAYLRHARIDGNFSLQHSRCDERVDLREVEVLGTTRFEEVQFRKGVYLSRSHVRGQLEWKMVSIDDRLRATHLSVEGPFSLLNCKLRGDVELACAHLEKELDLTGTEIRGELDLCSARIGKSADLAQLKLLGGLRIKGLKAPDLNVELEQVVTNLSSERQREWATAAEEWQLLQDAFERRKRSSDFDEAFLKTRQMLRRSASRGLGRIWRVLELVLVEWGTGYGTRPARVLGLSAAIILLFAALYSGFTGAIIFEGSELQEVGFHAARFVDYIYFSIVTFTTLGYGDMHPSYYGNLKYIVAMEAFVGAFLMALFAGTLARKIIRQ